MYNNTRTSCSVDIMICVIFLIGVSACAQQNAPQYRSFGLLSSLFHSNPLHSQRNYISPPKRNVNKKVVPQSGSVRPPSFDDKKGSGNVNAGSQYGYDFGDPPRDEDHKSYENAFDPKGSGFDFLPHNNKTYGFQKQSQYGYDFGVPLRDGDHKSYDNAFDPKGSGFVYLPQINEELNGFQKQGVFGSNQYVAGEYSPNYNPDCIHPITGNSYANVEHGDGKRLNEYGLDFGVPPRDDDIIIYNNAFDPKRDGFASPAYSNEELHGFLKHDTFGNNPYNFGKDSPYSSYNPDFSYPITGNSHANVGNGNNKILNQYGFSSYLSPNRDVNNYGYVNNDPYGSYSFSQPYGSGVLLNENTFSQHERVRPTYGGKNRDENTLCMKYNLRFPTIRNNVENKGKYPTNILPEWIPVIGNSNKISQQTNTYGGGLSANFLNPNVIGSLYASYNDRGFDNLQGQFFGNRQTGFPFSANNPAYPSTGNINAFSTPYVEGKRNPPYMNVFNSKELNSDFSPFSYGNIKHKPSETLQGNFIQNKNTYRPVSSYNNPDCLYHHSNEDTQKNINKNNIYLNAYSQRDIQKPGSGVIWPPSGIGLSSQGSRVICPPSGMGYASPCCQNGYPAVYPQPQKNRGLDYQKDENDVPAECFSTPSHPVCGTDNNTYINECLLKHAQKNNVGLKVAHEGYCVASPNQEKTLTSSEETIEETSEESSEESITSKS